jgi:hypothetical protein
VYVKKAANVTMYSSHTHTRYPSSTYQYRQIQREIFRTDRIDISLAIVAAMFAAIDAIIVVVVFRCSHTTTISISWLRQQSNL